MSPFTRHYNQMLSMSQATQAEFEAILHGAAIAPIERGFLRITGSDATRWLNGMVTNSIQALQPGEGNYNFLLNAQGRIQGDCIIFREPSEDEAAFLLVTDRHQLETVHALLDKFIIMDDVELVPADHLRHTVALVGPNAPDVLRAIERPLLADTESHADQTGIRLAYYGYSGAQLTTPMEDVVPCFEISASFDLAPLVADAVKAGAALPSEETLNAARIFFGVPVYGVDIRDRDLPQETNQTQALHFSKGCYLGQEIVERIRSRGQVHRLLTRFRLEGDLPTSFPAPLESEGKPAGELTSAAIIPLPEGPQIYALGYARREFLELKKPFNYAGGTATPAPASDI